MNNFATPSREKELIEALATASAEKTKLRIIGGATSLDIGKPVDAEASLNVSRLSGITRFDPSAWTLEALAGTSLREINTELEAKRQILTFEPPNLSSLMRTEGEPTIGAVVAMNLSGPQRFLRGACRDALLGLRFADGSGRLLNCGGRTMKNVTGLDLTRLMCGSYGTLGVITHITLKVFPRPEYTASLLFDDLDVGEATRLFCKALSTPFEVSGAAWQDGQAVLRVEGSQAQLDYRLDHLQKLLWPAGLMEGREHLDFWSSVRDVKAFSGTEETVWRISTKATEAPQLVMAAREQLGARFLLDQGAAVVWLVVPSDDPEQARIIRSLIPAGEGYATLIRASRTLREAVSPFQPQSSRLESLSRGLRRQFDPEGILNPGLMGT